MRNFACRKRSFDVVAYPLEPRIPIPDGGIQGKLDMSTMSRTELQHWPTFWADDLKPLSLRVSEAVVECARGLLLMVTRGIFPRVSSISNRFKIQLIYQNLDTPGAFEGLMNLFSFSSKAVRQTLVYTKHCSDIQHVIERKESNETDWNIIIQDYNNPMVSSGCLLYLQQTSRSCIRRIFNLGVHLSDNYIYKRLSYLIEEYALAIKKYISLTGRFLSADMTPSHIENYVDRGLLIHLVHEPVGEDQRSYTHPFLNLATHQLIRLDMYLEAGYDIDREPWTFRLHSAWQYARFLMHSVAIHWNLRWLLERGSDVNRGYSHNSMTLLEYVIHRPVSYNFENMKLLVQYGSDVNDALKMLIRSLEVRLDATFERYLVRYGRPDLGGIYPPENRSILFYFFLDEATRIRDVDQMELVKDLVAQGLDVHLRDAGGQNAIDRLRKMAIKKHWSEAVYSSYLFAAARFIESCGAATSAKRRHWLTHIRGGLWFKGLFAWLSSRLGLSHSPFHRRFLHDGHLEGNRR